GDSRCSGPPGSSHAEQVNRVLFSISDAVNSTHDLEELYRTIHQILGTVIDATNFFIAIVDRQKRTLYFPYHVDTVDDDFSALTDFDITTSLTGLVVAEKKPVLLHATELQARAAKNGVWGPEPLIWLGVPLLNGGEVIGVIAVQSYIDAGVYDENDLQLLAAVSHQIAIAIDRKRSLDKLEKSEEQYRELVENANCIILRIDNKGRISFFNEFAQRFFGYQVDEVIGKSVIGTIIPKTDSAGNNLQALIADTLKRPELHGVNENENMRSDGTRIWISWANRPFFNESGEMIDLLCIGNDITERKQAEEVLRQSEETFRNIVQASPMGIHIYQLQNDDRLVLVGTNPAADRLLGIDNTKFFGMTLEEAFPSLANTEIPLRYRNAARLGENWQTEQVEYRQGEIAGAFEVYVFQMSQGKAAVLFNDITERKQSEEERAKLQLQLTQAQKMESIGRLAGGVAHDFNNMLGVILGHTEMALNKLDPSEPLFASLQEIGKAARRSADLTRQLLAFARKQTVTPKVLDLNETVSGMLAMLQRLIGENIDLVWLPGENLGSLNMDPSQLDQILANLCVNARDAIVDTGKVTIETHAAAFDEVYCRAHAGSIPGDYILLAVSDNGCGMDSEIQAHLFEPFFTTKEKGKGTGLGLATIYGIVKQNNGFINVYSEPGQGTTVRIYLPWFAGGATALVNGDAVNSAARGSEIILLVEDEPMILEMTKTMLELQGYNVLPAATPGEAIRLAREHAGEIHLLMTDVVMPEMNGKDLAKNLLSLYPDLKRLFMSGYTANVIAHHGVLDEGVNFIQKPFSMDDLAAKIRDVLDRDLR
ncbi:MAG: PAS domain S-box protein, partial [Pseudomonadota bacterium]